MQKKHLGIMLVLFASFGLFSCSNGITSYLSSSLSSLTSLASSSSSLSSPSSSISSSVSSAASSALSSSESSLASSSSSSEAPKLYKTSAQFDGVNNETLEETLCYQQPIWGQEMSEKYPLATLDKFQPTLVYDDKGSLGFQMAYDYDETYTWHLKNTYSSIGKTSVPTSYLQNVIFDAPASISSTGQATLKGLVNWNPNATIMANNGIVVANQVVDMSTQIDSVSLADGTIITDWTLAPANTAFASASGKTFTALKASNKTNIKIMNGTAQIGSFSVRVLSEALGAMSDFLLAKPLHKQYQASLIREQDSAVLASALHQDNYFTLENKVQGTQSGVLLYGEEKLPLGYKIQEGKLETDNFLSYPLEHYLPGQDCPLDDPYTYLTDSLNTSFPPEAPVIIKANLNEFITLFSSYVLGFSFSSLTGTNVEPSFIGVSFAKESQEFTFELYEHAEGTSVYTSLGYQIKLGLATQKNETVEKFLLEGKLPSLISVPSKLVEAYQALSETKNYTLLSSSYWTKKGDPNPLGSGEELKGLENKAHLYQTECCSYIDGSNYLAEDPAHYNYKGGVERNGKLYLITGVPDYVKGVTIWSKEDITSCLIPGASEKQNISDFWKNSNVPVYLTSAALSHENLSKLNLHLLTSEEIL